jgi:hypothetical protein
MSSIVDDQKSVRVVMSGNKLAHTTIESHLRVLKTGQLQLSAVKLELVLKECTQPSYLANNTCVSCGGLLSEVKCIRASSV